jgi:acetolactate synthase-1/2/3 large subunit
MTVADRIVALLEREGAEHIVGFPENRLLDAASLGGLKPIITRTERVAVNIADGYARTTRGEKLLPTVMQYGPGAEAAFAAVAQAYGDRSPILLLPGEHATTVTGPSTGVRATEIFRPITRWAATLSDAASGPSLFRQALNAVYGVRNGPVMLSLANDVLNGDPGAADWNIPPLRRHLTQAAPDDVAELVRALRAAKHPVILAGQGVLYAGATAELVQLAERTSTPVATTLNGKGAFPETHPLALGAAARTRPEAVDEALARADLVLGIGTSFTRSLYITPMPPGVTLGQVVNDPADLGTGYDIAFACVGDAKLVLAQALAALGEPEPHDPAVADEIAASHARFIDRWRPRLESDESPISPYRVVWELLRTLDPARTMITHDAGHPRDQISPFWQAPVPGGYLGWGKSTQLGTGLGLAIGAQLARPDLLGVNLMGDAAFGMVGMDFETAVRSRIPILTVVLNNGLMGGYREWMPNAVERHSANLLGGSYAAIATALGGHSERVERAQDLHAAIERCIASTGSGKATLLEVMTCEEHAIAGEH